MSSVGKTVETTPDADAQVSDAGFTAPADTRWSRAGLPDIRGKAVSSHLDMIRGVAAVAVLVYHVRYRFFYEYSDLDHPGLVAKAFFALTSFGHDAVMVFFVLSGFFISASVFRDCQRRRWSWRDYALNRGVRLYLVLLPGMLLTLGWDLVGLQSFPDSVVYTAEVRGWSHDFFRVPERLTATTFAGNLCFLQMTSLGILPYGSNAPLWSLAYEFWYYVLFPLCAVGLFRGGIGARIMCLLGALGAAWLMGPAILTYFPVWLLGTALCFIPRLHVGAVGRSLLTLVTFLVFATLLLGGHVGALRHAVGGQVTDYMTAIGFLGFAYALLHHDARPKAGWYSSFAKWIADFSYTLYVVHMPLLVFLRAWWIPDRPWSPSAYSLLAAAGLTALSIAYANVVARLTEANTAGARRLVGAAVNQVLDRSA